MPIRMTDDDEDENKEEGKSDDSGSGGFWLLAIFGVIGTLLFKYPKVMIPTLIVVSLLAISLLCEPGDDYEYEEDDETSQNESTVIHPKGAIFDPEKYAATKAYEPLAKGFGNKIPSSASLIQYAPRPQNQGSQGSCVGWAVSYAARTILEAKATGQNPNSIAFSPAHPFNQNTSPKCDGSYPADVLEDLKEEGALPLSEFPYNENSCRTKPNSSQKDRAKAFRVDGYQRLTVDGDDYNTDIDSVRQYIASGSPVIITMDVGGTFNELESSDWHPTKKDYKKVKQYQESDEEDDDWGPHAMAVVGYDDNRNGGSVQVMNSWGTDWGNKGTFWLRYSDFDKFILEAFSIYPSLSAVARDKRNLEFGLIENSSKDYIPLKKINDFTYRTKDPIEKGTRFKVSVKNDSPVYIYIFGKEEDGSSYVLFPYNDQHSAYCGPDGVRVFPRKQSLEADDIGKRDSIAVVFAYQSLDYQKLNKLINDTSGSDYGNKFRTALSSRLSSVGKHATNGEVIELSTMEKETRKFNVLIIEFDKK
ncbi:C1 family peptidase [Leptospira sp. GIMC2001]|uniref:C1 family peptidase n=1 Tax=Leptospira sp. GIMC2001 TaxID=1513297 RepID=UPI002349C9E8|nr:C1 family peptidase [Leptospira sp. GIMC2001]WCL47736.1 DUF4384 domain-containing protein [Leptospira sp. GIMC2001]